MEISKIEIKLKIQNEADKEKAELHLYKLLEFYINLLTLTGR